MNPTSLRVVVAAAGVTVAIAISLFLLLSNDGSAGDRQTDGAAKQQMKSRGPVGDQTSPERVSVRSVDPANYIAAEQSTDPDRLAEFRLQADRSEDLGAAVRAGAEFWQPTLIDMDFSDVANETYLECSSKYLRQPCSYDIDYVIEVEEPGIGRIVFGRAVMERAYADDCEQYVKCTVRGNVGSTVVLSPEVNATFARRKSQTDNYPVVTAEQLQEMLAIMQTAVATMEEKGPDGQPDWEYRLELERSYITLIKMRLATMAAAN